MSIGNNKNKVTSSDRGLQYIESKTVLYTFDSENTEDKQFLVNCLQAKIAIDTVTINKQTIKVLTFESYVKFIVKAYPVESKAIANKNATILISCIALLMATLPNAKIDTKTAAKQNENKAVKKVKPAPPVDTVNTDNTPKA